MHERSSHLRLGLATDKKKHRLQGSAFSSVLARVIGTTGPCSAGSASRDRRWGDLDAKLVRSFVVHMCERASSSCMKMGEGGGWCKQKQARQAFPGWASRQSLFLAGGRLEGGQTADLSRSCL
jgi:hypothetical protein